MSGDGPPVTERATGPRARRAVPARTRVRCAVPPVGRPGRRRVRLRALRQPDLAGYEQAVGGLEGGEAVVFALRHGRRHDAAAGAARARRPVVLRGRAYYHGPRARRRPPAATRRRGPGRHGRRVAEAARAPSWSGSRRPRTRRSTSCDIRALAEARAARPWSTTRRRPARPAPARPRRRLRRGERDQALSGHADLLLGYVAARDAGARADVRAASYGGDRGAVRGLARHRSLATLALRLERECANALRARAAARRRDDVAECAIRGSPTRPRARDRQARRCTSSGRSSRFTLADGRARRALPRGARAGHRGHELRRHAHDGRAPRPLGRRRRARRASSG